MYIHSKHFNDTDFFSLETINSVDNSIVIRKKFFSLLDVSESDKHYTPQLAVKKGKAKHVEVHNYISLLFFLILHGKELKQWVCLDYFWE